MSKVEFEAPNTMDAIELAAKTLNIPPEKLVFSIISTGSSGFLGINKKNARILVDILGSTLAPEEENSPARALEHLVEPIEGTKVENTTEPIKKAPESPESHEPQEALGSLEPSKETEKRKPGPNKATEYLDLRALYPFKNEGYLSEELNLGEKLSLKGPTLILPNPLTQTQSELTSESMSPMARAGKEILSKIIELMDIEAEINVRTSPNIIILDIVTKENSLLIGRRGIGLDSLELIVNKIIRKRFVSTPTDTDIRVIVDLEDYRARRHFGILNKTLLLTLEAVKTGKIQSIPQLTAYERMLVTQVTTQLADIKVETVGIGALRNMLIIPLRFQKSWIRGDHENGGDK
jgi:spoIIIJ-associated protein